MRFLRHIDYAGLCAYIVLGWLATGMTVVHSAQAQENANAPKVSPALGTIQAMTDKSLKLKTDAGTDLVVQLPAEVKILRVEPGSRTLKDAVKIYLSDLAVGDRILVRGEPGSQPNEMVAGAIVAMKKEDIAKKRASEREEWQRHGIGGLVKSVDAATETIVISTLAATGAKDVTIHAPVGTILRRYAPGSINFDESAAAPLSDIKPGDQLRARGARSADGSEFTADEIVSGTFHNIAGTITLIDSGTSTLTVSDLASKKNVEVSVTPQSQLRRLPVPMAQRLAMRLKGVSAESGSSGTAAPAWPSNQNPSANVGQGSAAGQTAVGGPGGGQRGNGDLQQMLSHLPSSPLTDFRKGDAVMIVATFGAGSATVITLLGGVEPILQSVSEGQATSILTPWSLASGGADAGTP